MNLGKTQPSNSPRIFISHAWEDKALVRRLEAALKAAGAEVWVDHVGVRGGDNLPERISEALDWCDTLLLVWSNAAAGDVQTSNAIANRKLARLIHTPQMRLTPKPCFGYFKVNTTLTTVSTFTGWPFSKVGR